MAKARLISCSLSTSRKFAELGRAAGKLGEFAQVLFPLIVVHSDDFGRSSGDVFTVKHAVFPTSPRSLEAFGRALEALVRVGLLERWEAAGQTVIAVTEFDRHQANLHKRTRSRFPDPPGSSGKVPEIPSELKRTEEKRTEEGEAPAAPPAPAVDADAAARLLEAWNAETTAPIPKALTLGTSRLRKVRARRREHPPEWWLAVIRRIEASAFCRGANDRGWVATFDWLVENDENAAKVLEGKFDDRAPGARPPAHSNAAPSPDAYAKADSRCSHVPMCADDGVHLLMLQREAEAAAAEGAA